MEKFRNILRRIDQYEPNFSLGFLTFFGNRHDDQNLLSPKIVLNSGYWNCITAVTG